MKRTKLNTALLLTIFFAPLYLVRVNFLHIPTNAFEMLAVLIISLSLFAKRGLLISEVNKIPRLLLFGIFCLILGVLSSILLNSNQLPGFGILKSWFLIPILFSFYLYLFVDRMLEIEKVFKIIFLSTATVGAIAIAYKILGYATYDNRLSAFYLSPNHLAMYLAPGIFFGGYFVIKSFGAERKNLFFNLLLLLMICMPLYFTYSYGAWLAIFFSILITILMMLPVKKYFLKITFFFGFGILILLLSQINNPKLSSLISDYDHSSLSSRVTIWQVSSRLIKENPVVGIGPGNFQSAYLSLQKYFPPYLEWAVPQPHNLFLAFWLQAGSIGLFGFLLILYFVFKTLLPLLKNKKNAAYAAPLFGFFLYTIIHGLIDTTYWKNDLSFLFWINVFLLSSLQKIFKSNNCND